MAGAIWYPNYNNDICKNDNQHEAYKTNFFHMVNECCSFKCMEDMVGCQRQVLL